jgi:hypothetical protein
MGRPSLVPHQRHPGLRLSRTPRVGARQPSIDPHIHVVPVVRHKRPAPATLCALSPDAGRRGYLRANASISAAVLPRVPGMCRGVRTAPRSHRPTQRRHVIGRDDRAAI